MLTLPPLALYIHVPWCVRKCPYCDFNSHEFRQELPEQQYLAALQADLSHDLPFVQGRKLTSIFFGGGTPSLMSPAFIADILSAAERTIGFSADIEITLEANPGTFEQEKFRGFRSAGVNRLSIGIQSFHNEHLQRLGRIHDRAGAIAAASSARAAGFDNFNLDLMHGLPQQTLAQALADLAIAVSVAPTHISWYQLTIEPNTTFYSQPPQLPDDDSLCDIQDRGHDYLSEAGYRQYEVSAYTQPNRQSRHNLNYWQFGDYLGIGAGAHGKITLPASNTPARNTIVRTAKTRTPEDYLARSGDYSAQRTVVAPQELALEFFMNGLRLVDGVPRKLYEGRTGLAWRDIEPRWCELVAKGLVRDANDRLATTPQGFRFLNLVLEQLAG